MYIGCHYRSKKYWRLPLVESRFFHQHLWTFHSLLLLHLSLLYKQKSRLDILCNSRIPNIEWKYKRKEISKTKNVKNNTILNKIWKKRERIKCRMKNTRSKDRYIYIYTSTKNGKNKIRTAKQIHLWNITKMKDLKNIPPHYSHTKSYRVPPKKKKKLISLLVKREQWISFFFLSKYFTITLDMEEA